jgi:hypothetical protein
MQIGQGVHDAEGRAADDGQLGHRLGEDPSRVTIGEGLGGVGLDGWVSDPKPGVIGVVVVLVELDGFGLSIVSREGVVKGRRRRGRSRVAGRPLTTLGSSCSPATIALVSRPAAD